MWRIRIIPRRARRAKASRLIARRPAREQEKPYQGVIGDGANIIYDSRNIANGIFVAKAPMSLCDRPFSVHEPNPHRPNVEPDGDERVYCQPTGPSTPTMSLKSFRRIIRRLRQKSPPDVVQFGRDVGEVMSARISRAMTGDLSAAEARRMVLEKQSAGIRAHLAYTQALLKGDPAAASRGAFDIYHRAVKANRKRLRKRRWRWIRPLP